MSALALTEPTTVRVNRTQFRDNLKTMLDKAHDQTVIEISGTKEEQKKLMLDGKYFDQLVECLRSLMETLEITTDRTLFEQIMRAASTLEDDTRMGKLHSFEEAFREG